MWWTVAKEAATNWSGHKDARQGAALAYRYFPSTSIAVAGLLFGHDAVRMNLWSNGEFQYGYLSSIEDRKWPKRQRSGVILKARQKSRSSHEKAQSRNAQKWKIRQESQKQKAGDCDWAVGSAKERGQGPEEAVKEIIVAHLVR